MSSTSPLNVNLSLAPPAKKAPVPLNPYTTTTSSSEDTVPGVEMQNFTLRTPSEDGTYVKVTTHTERIIKIPQPPTPAELEEKRKSDILFAKIAAGVGTTLVALFALAVYADTKATRYRSTAVEKPETPELVRTEAV